jgi:4-amino-4-deoxy-L-arabinose transferase-like glycosyltransferase
MAGSIAAAGIGIVLLRLPRRVTQLLSRLSAVPAPAFVAAIALLTAALSATCALYSFHGFASTSDEIAQLWHARILTTGRWALPADPNPEFFSLDTVVDSGRWYSQFPIGGPLVMALGVLVGAPWIINPLLAGGSAVGVYLFARRAYGEASARAATALYSLAPMILIMAGTWMNHVPVLFFTTTGLAALAAWDHASTRGRRYAAAAAVGLCVGAIATIRPLDAVVVAAVVGLFQLKRLRSSPERFSDLLVQVVVGTIPVAVLLLANSQTTGAPFRFGYEVAWGPAHRVGFHVDPYGEPHTLSRGLDYALGYISQLNIYLMFWPVPALLFLIAALAANRRPSRWDMLLVAFIGAQTLAYAAYWYRGELLGPRFLYPIAPAAIILIARAPHAIGDRFGARWRHVARAAIVSCVIVAWFAPTSTFGVRGATSRVRARRQSLKIDLAAAVRNAGAHHALVFVRDQFSQRLARRLWALGVPRGNALQIIRTRDACTLLTAIQRAESGSGQSEASNVAAIKAIPPVVNPEGSIAGDPSIHIASQQSLTPACEAEISEDTAHPAVPFGAALVLEPINARGQIDGDVIYVADLGGHNEVLRARFGDREWYRVRLIATEGELRAVLEHY